MIKKERLDKLLVDGNSGETLVGHVDTSVPLERDEQWLKK